MKRYTIIVICILLYLPAQGQIDPIEMNPQTPSSIFRLSFISPKLAIEFAPADFAYGLNWSGVINDKRIEKYS